MIAKLLLRVGEKALERVMVKALLPVREKVMGRMMVKPLLRVREKALERVMLRARRKSALTVPWRSAQTTAPRQPCRMLRRLAKCAPSKSAQPVLTLMPQSQRRGTPNKETKRPTTQRT